MKIAQLERRKIEADMIGLLYAQMCETMPPDAALHVVSGGLEKAAFEAGRAFASAAPDGPSLEHFKGVVDIWAAGNAVDYDILESTPASFRLEITRCAYAEAYRDMRLPDELVRTISCCRDAPFARGYSEHIEFARSRTIAGGAPCCDFLYRWKE